MAKILTFWKIEVYASYIPQKISMSRASPKSIYKAGHATYPDCRPCSVINFSQSEALKSPLALKCKQTS